MAAPPEPIVHAVGQAELKYDVPPDLLFGIWTIESGGNYPNPYANGLGYGGEFGTAVATPFGPASATERITEPPLQQQADTAAKILAQQLTAHHGNISEALMAYSGGGYSSVPGETTYGTYNPKKVPGGPSITDVGANFQTGVGDVGHTVSSTVSNAVGGVTGWVENILQRGGKIVLGAGLALLGLYLIAKAFNVVPSLPGLPTGGGGGASRDNSGGGGSSEPEPPDSRENTSGEPLSQSSRAARRRAGFEPADRRKPARGAPGSAKLAQGDTIPF